MEEVTKSNIYILVFEYNQNFRDRDQNAEDYSEFQKNSGFGRYPPSKAEPDFYVPSQTNDSDNKHRV